MGIRGTLRQWADKAAHRYLFGYPPGVDFLYDLRQFLPAVALDTIFDVGANEGQSTASYLEHFPQARIFSFEPASATFRQLKERFSNLSNVHCMQCALGAASGRALLQLSENSKLNKVVAASSGAPERSEEITIRTVDDVCGEHRIARINLLKIDTEGLDLEVLQGAGHMLGSMSVDFIRVEASMNPNNRLHVPLESFKQYLEAKGYLLLRSTNRSRMADAKTQPAPLGSGLHVAAGDRRQLNVVGWCPLRSESEQATE